MIFGHKGQLIVDDLIDNQDGGPTAHDESSLPN